MLDVEPVDRRADLVGDAVGTLLVGPREDQRKLLTAVSGDDVARPADHTLERSADLGQGGIAGLMSKAVVVVAEVIEVDHDDRERRGFPQGASPLVAEKLLEMTVVGYPRQRVDAGEPVERLGRFLQLGRAMFELFLERLDRRRRCDFSRAK